MIYRCCDETRRLRVAAHPVLNGIDYVEVLDREAPAIPSPRQRTLLVRFVKAAPPLLAANFEITGGDRIDDVAIVWATPANAPDAALVTPQEAAFLTGLPDADQVIALRTSSSGDYATYTLHLVASAASLAPPPGIDPLLARVGFSFKVECPSDFDCAPQADCGTAKPVPPRINYLAKDYKSFRRLMLDRMSETLPDWHERNAADLGVALVEMLAYVGDRLSYAQDAVATEAYLGTARRRSSVRRHARLVDHVIHDGASARVWVQVQVQGGPVALSANATSFTTRVGGFDPVIVPGLPDRQAERLLMQPPLVFEPLHDATLFAAHNRMDFHDWGDGECCLPKGAVRATLRGNFPDLAAGDVLVFEERIGPRTGRAADADPAKRCAVRIVQVVAGITDPLTVPPTPITEIRWADEDALAFALCLSARTDEAFGGEVVREVSHALGNMVLADHGQARPVVDLGAVPQPHLHLVAEGGDRCATPARIAVPPRFHPLLPEAPLSQAARYTHPPASAAAAMAQHPRDLVPQVWLVGSTPLGDTPWVPRRDLLGSKAADPHFVVEVEADGRARLRFGDDRLGKRPDAGTAFAARYRIGSGPVGNIGADALGHVITANGAITGLRNPLPASGGTAPETTAEARIAAPQAFRTQQRAVTPADYEAMALRFPGVQRAAATFRWNGHGHTVFVTVDRIGGRAITPQFEADLIAFLEPFRMAGYDLEIDDPVAVPIELDLLVCVRLDHFRSQVRRAVLDVLGSRRSPDGRTGLFHPDNLSFAQDIWLSRIVAAAQAVDGVESVTPQRFRRQGQPDPSPLETGVLRIGRLEIAQLANDPDYPERGKLTLTMGGGK